MNLEFNISETGVTKVTDVTKEGKLVMHIEVDTNSRSPRIFGITWRTELSQEEALQAVIVSFKALSTRYPPEGPIKAIYDNIEMEGLDPTKIPDRFGWLRVEGPLTYYLEGGNGHRDIGVIGDNQATDEVLKFFTETSEIKLSSVELRGCRLKLHKELDEFPSFDVKV